jgi:6-pyruvoyltetrahydropterin/6-carboxytetrahydropterin synthase
MFTRNNFPSKRLTCYFLVMYKITASASFSAAHHLREYRGKCENQHGHNWRVTASVRGETLDSDGMLVDFGDLRRMLREVCAELDHTDVNIHPYFAINNPTAENIAAWIFGRIEKKLAEAGYAASMHEVSVEETDGSTACYSAS